MFTSILTDMTNGLSLMEGALCMASSLGLGLIIALVYRNLKGSSQSFLMTLALLPMVVTFVIMMVNGNLGTGVAVVGAFSLVRFRSLPGTSKEIFFIFFAMSMGLAIGMGYITFAIFVCICTSVVALILPHIRLFQGNQCLKEIKILIPEDLDYTEIFDDLFQKYTKSNELIRVKTVQLGTMIEVIYQIELKNVNVEKQFIDEIRIRNGNLAISCARKQVQQDEL